MLNLQVPETRCPILCMGAKVKSDFAEGCLARADSQKPLMEARFAVPVEHPSGEICTMLTDNKMPTLSILKQRRDAGLVDYDIDCVEPTVHFVRKPPRVRLITNPHIATQAQPVRKPCQKQYGGNRSTQLQQLSRHEARPRTMSIIAVIGVRSYPASAACSASTAGWSPFDARASAHNNVERVPDRQ